MYYIPNGEDLKKNKKECLHLIYYMYLSAFQAIFSVIQVSFSNFVRDNEIVEIFLHLLP